MTASVVGTAPLDGIHLVTGNVTITVSYSLLIPSRSTTDSSKDTVGISFGIEVMGHLLDGEDP
jgi:hypothetical protein